MNDEVSRWERVRGLAVFIAFVTVLVLLLVVAVVAIWGDAS